MEVCTILITGDKPCVRIFEQPYAGPCGADVVGCRFIERAKGYVEVPTRHGTVFCQPRNDSVVQGHELSSVQRRGGLVVVVSLSLQQRVTQPPCLPPGL